MSSPYLGNPYGRLASPPTDVRPADLMDGPLWRRAPEAGVQASTGPDAEVLAGRGRGRFADLAIERTARWSAASTANRGHRAGRSPVPS